MTKRILVVVAVIASIVAMASVVPADVPHLISFQGKLHDNAGNPLTGPYLITFRIYSAESAGMSLWSEVKSVTCDDGLYSVILGQITPLTLDFNGQYWLALQVTGDNELVPRYRLVSVPTALRAQVANSADQVRWNNLTNVPAGFADGTDDVGAAGGVSQISAGTGITVTNPTGPTTTVAANVGTGASQVAAGNHTHDASGIISGLLSNARLNMGHGNGIDADKLDGKHATAFSDSAHQHDTRYYTESELNTNDGTANQGGDPVSWTKVKDIPAGFADGVDNTGGGGGAAGWVDDGSVVRLETNTDNVGIGTTTPDAKLHIYGDDPTLKVSDVSSGFDGRGSAYLKLERGGIGKDRAQVVYSDGTASKWHAGLLYNNGKPTPYFHISQRDYLDNGTTTYIPEFTITTEGNVGIGTAGPTNLLELYSSAPKLYFNRGSSTSNLAGLYWRSAGDDFEGAFVRNNSTGNVELYTNYSGGTPRVLITDAGAVGIGTTTPNATLDINGGLFVTGAYTGDIGPNNGAPFPRPAYDSGWVTISQGSNTTLTHNLGGSRDNYVVDVCFFDYETGPNQTFYGGLVEPPSEEFRQVYYGAFWHSLTTQKIEISRGTDDTDCDKVRVRIWYYN